MDLQEEDVFEYDVEEEGYWEDMSLREFLAEKGISLTPDRFIIVIEDEVIGTEIEVVEIA